MTFNLTDYILKFLDILNSAIQIIFFIPILVIFGIPILIIYFLIWLFKKL